MRPSTWGSIPLVISLLLCSYFCLTFVLFGPKFHFQITQLRLPVLHSLHLIKEIPINIEVVWELVWQCLTEEFLILIQSMAQSVQLPVSPKPSYTLNVCLIFGIRPSNTVWMKWMHNLGSKLTSTHVLLLMVLLIESTLQSITINVKPLLYQSFFKLNLKN